MLVSSPSKSRAVVRHLDISRLLKPVTHSPTLFSPFFRLEDSSNSLDFSASSVSQKCLRGGRTTLDTVYCMLLLARTGSFKYHLEIVLKLFETKREAGGLLWERKNQDPIYHKSAAFDNG